MINWVKSMIKYSQEILDILNGTPGFLMPREEKILKLRSGIEDGNPKTLKEIGEKFGVTGVRIRQLEVRALIKIRRFKKINE